MKIKLKNVKDHQIVQVYLKNLFVHFYYYYSKIFLLDKIPSTTTRTVSIDRSSSDKENHSSNTSITVVTNTRVSPRTAMINSRTQSGKKSTPKVCRNFLMRKKRILNKNIFRQM